MIKALEKGYKVYPNQTILFFCQNWLPVSDLQDYYSMNISKNHFVAVVGGSIAGSEAAFQLAEQGFQVVVFDQNILPYGKIEDGLPLWHIKLRDKEEGNINRKLSHKNIYFVPNIKLGKDVLFEDLDKNWGFSAVLLAIGASTPRLAG